ncbi:MAG: [FeFe] hydrogenase H-cluster radical SAM maturase HydE [Lachnospiraceae bacterium]|nr:[FeFe] hydrogenase H-cluster radical SAM maturase HydE [Lachnospiraceae bacterium]
MDDKHYAEIVEKLAETGDLSDVEFLEVINCTDTELDELLAERARAVRERYYGKDVYLRGLVEYSNICKNNCYYCGIRRGNKNCERYRLTKEQILECGDIGYDLGFGTIVLQGGEDPFFTVDIMAEIIRELKKRHSDIAVTLSIGEMEREDYQRLFDAGADRFLLRHETADREHYGLLHPTEMSFEHRMNCLKALKEIGYQVGAGMMIGSPFQKPEHLVKDLRFLLELKPEMVGIGPFIPHHDTEFKDFPAGSVSLTLRLLSVIRLILPDCLLPATTALGTLDPKGREKGLLAGANVIMPNLSPTDVRGKYLLYDNKICTGEEAAECIRCMERRVESVGYKVAGGRGDHIKRT